MSLVDLPDRILHRFFPYRPVSEGLQRRFGFARTPACREEHGRMAVVIRGEGLSARGDDEVVVIAEQLSHAARELARKSSISKVRSRSRRAVMVIFEDEVIHGGAVLTSSKTYVAPFSEERSRL